MNKLFILLLLAFPIFARENRYGACEKGAVTVSTASIISTTQVMGSFPSCKVTVYYTGTVNIASIFSDNLGTVKANPFIANNDGSWNFFATNGVYDIRMENGGLPTPFTIGAQEFFDPIDAGLVSVKAGPYYCAGNGTTDDTACITAAMNSNLQLYFPDGTYKVVNNPNPITITNWSGSIRMSSKSQILCSFPHQGCFEIFNATNSTLDGFNLTYGNSEPTDQCGDHGGAGNCWAVAFQGSTNLVIKNFNLINTYGIALFIIGGSGGSSPPTTGCSAPQIINGRIINTSRDGLHVQNCSNTTVSDIYVESSGDDSFGFQNTSDRPNVNGLTATNLQSINSLGGCFSLSGTEQTLTNFVCQSPSSFGITISFPGFLQLPWSGVISHGIISNVSFQMGGICPCGAPGLEFFQGTGVAKFDDIDIDTTDGVGVYFTTFDETPPLAPEVDLSNIRIHNVGLQAMTSSGGYCYLLNNVTTLVLSNLYADSCPWDGFAIFNNTNVFASGLRIRNASTAGVGGPGLGHSVYLTNVDNFMVSDTQTMDTQGTGTSLIVGESSTTNRGFFNGVQFYVASGSPSFNTSSSNVQYSNINVGGNITNGHVTWGATNFTGGVTIVASSATPLTISNKNTDAFGTAFTINSAPPHFQALFALLDQGTLKWSIVKGTDLEATPQYFAIFDALNNLDAILINPNSPVSGFKERIQLGPSGTSLVWAILPVFANNTAALAGGLVAGDLYKDSSGIVHATQ